MSRSQRLAFALEHLRFNRNGLATLRVDQGVRDFLVAKLQSGRPKG
jgi:hypothetical protein